MALEVTVNEIKRAADGGPGSQGMSGLIAKMVKADRSFPAEPDEAVLTKAFAGFMAREEAREFQMAGIGISARTFAKMTAKMLTATTQRQRSLSGQALRADAKKKKENAHAVA